MAFVLGSIFAGVASPTESAAFGVVSGFVLSLINRTLNVAHLSKIKTLTNLLLYESDPFV